MESELIRKCPAPDVSYVPSLETVADLKDILEALGLKPSMAMATAIAKVETGEGVDLSFLKDLIPSVDYEFGCFSTPQLAEVVGIKEDDLNRILAQLGYQYEIDGKWAPTKKGLKHGEFFPAEREGRWLFKWMWSSQMLYLLGAREEE